MPRALDGDLRNWVLGMTDEYLMWSLVAADRRARLATQARSRAILCLCNCHILAVLTREAKPFAFSSSPVQGVAQYLLGSAARMLVQTALAPPRLRLRYYCRLVGAWRHWSCPRLVVTVWWFDVWLIQFESWIPSWTWVGLSILKTWEVGRPTCCCRC